jgi:hypothetical protein
MGPVETIRHLHEGVAVFGGDERSCFLEVGPANEDGVFVLRLVQSELTIEGIAKSKFTVGAAERARNERDDDGAKECAK